MRLLISTIVLTFLISCSEVGTNKLEEKEETIELTYIAWACACANWAPIEEIEKHPGISGDSLADLCIYIEHADKSPALPDTICASGDIIKLTGKFYKEKGLPKDVRLIENPDKARVFRYTNYEIVKSNYSYFLKE